jgi:PKD repeat protein
MSASGIVYGTSSSNQIITVDALPIVSFTYVITNGPSGPTISFNDNSTGFPNPTSWYWDFGDGFNSIYQNPSHQYAISGSYTVKHSATNSLGTNWSNMTVTIS